MNHCCHVCGMSKGWFRFNAVQGIALLCSRTINGVTQAHQWTNPGLDKY